MFKGDKRFGNTVLLLQCFTEILFFSLHVLLNFLYIDFFYLFVLISGAALDAEDQQGKTALDYAVTYGKKSCANLLKNVS